MSPPPRDRGIKPGVAMWNAISKIKAIIEENRGMSREEIRKIVEETKL